MSLRRVGGQFRVDSRGSWSSRSRVAVGLTTLARKRKSPKLLPMTAPAPVVVLARQALSGKLSLRQTRQKRERVLPADGTQICVREAELPHAANCLR